MNGETFPASPSAATQVAVLVAPADGVTVLREVFRSLQGNFPGAIVILVHPGSGRERGIADNLNVASNFMILPGADGTLLRDGHGYVGAVGARLEIGADGRLTRASLPLEEEPIRIDGMLTSLASRYGFRAVAVALTALDEAEREGFRRVRASGGYTVALDESDRLWADASGPRVVPDPADELLSTSALGPRLNATLAPDPERA